MIAELLLLAMGLALSAFFSGSETGFYRASRLRIVMDAMQGSRLSRGLLFLTNRPPLFVATALVGNNMANYVTSLAIVLLTQSVFGTDVVMEIGASVLFSPLIFVYGELLPKNLFYQAPNRLLRGCSPLILVFTVLFAPVSAVLWSLGRILQKLFGQSPERVQLTLARQELGDFLVEGQYAGLLHPTQLTFAQNFFLVATQPVSKWMVPLSRMATVDRSATRTEALKKAQKLKRSEMPVFDRKRRELAGYVRTIELIINSDSSSLSQFINPLVEIRYNDSHGEAILQLQASGELMAQVIDEDRNPLGVVTLEALMRPLLNEPLPAVPEASTLSLQ